MIVMPLGVGSATPTADRHLASVALWREGRIFLFDCGENAQMRMLQAGMKRSKIDYIFITHLDGDHFFGLPGLLTTMQLQRRDKELHIIGPKGIKSFVDNIFTTVNVDLGFEIIYTEISHDIDHQVVVEEEEFFVEARTLKHNTFCVGYRLQERDKPGKVDAALAAEMGITEDAHFKALKAGEDVTLEDGTVVEASQIVGEPVKGKVFAYITDTEFCENCIRLAENATILYHEATFGQALKDKAAETGHCTAQEAAIVAKTAGAERLVIGHFSARYTNPFVLLKEAKQVFDDTWIATELRPIMTDPEQEKGIFKPAPTQTQQQDRNDYEGKRNFRGRQGDDRRGSGGYRPRQQGGGRGRYDNRGGGGGGRYSGGRSDYNRDDRRSYPPRDRGGDDRRSYQNRDRDDRRPYSPRGDDRRNYTPRDRGDYNRGGDDRRSYPPRNRDYDNRGRSDRDQYNSPRPDHRDNRRDQDQNSGKNSSNPMPITPRTPFDEFDRF